MAFTAELLSDINRGRVLKRLTRDGSQVLKYFLPQAKISYLSVKLWRAMARVNDGHRIVS